MAFLEVANVIGTASSILGGIDFVQKYLSNSDAETLFKESFVKAVEESAPYLASLTETKNLQTVDVDRNTLDEVIASLQEIDTATFISLADNEKLAKITTLFQKCVILPGHQLPTKDLAQRIRPIVARASEIFFDRLPHNQEAFNQTSLQFDKAQSEGQERFTKDVRDIKGDVDEIKETTRATLDVNLELKAEIPALSVRMSDAVKTAVATEHQSQVDTARDFLKKHKPQSALDLLENLKQRIWMDASPMMKFHLLTTIAAAQLVLNNEQESARLVLKAFQYNPEDEAALGNRALAHFLLGETEQAAAYAEKTLEKNPVNTDAYAILVGVSTDEETLEEVIAKVPDYLRETPQVAHAISDIARHRGNLEEAIKWRETLVAPGQEDTPHFKAALATTLIEQVLDNRHAVFTNQITDSQKEQLRRAVELLTEAWDCVASTELRTVRTDWIINRSMAQRLLGETASAIKDLDTALAVEPSNPGLLKNRAIFAFEQGEEKIAVEFFEKLQSVPETPEVHILLASVHFAGKRYREATTLLADFLQTNPSAELRDSANGLLINIHLAEERFEAAQRIATTIRESSPTSILNLVDMARISKAMGKDDEALSLLKEACAYAQHSDTFPEIAELANELYDSEHFEEAATLYESVADTSLNSPFTHRLLTSYYRSGDTAKALELCRTLREKHGPLEHISEIECEIYEDIGDLKRVVAIGEAYLNAFPADTEMQIRLAYTHYRLNNTEAFDSLLRSPFDLKTLSLHSCLNLAFLHQIGAQPESALDIMYETRRLHYNNPDAHLKYINLYYQVDVQLGELLSPTQVQPGTAVCIDDASRAEWYIVEAREDADIAHQELDVNHPLAQRLLGKEVDDELYLRQGMLGPEHGKITKIQSKYVYAVQESLKRFPSLFPEDSGMRTIKLDDSADATDSVKFQPLFDFIDRQHTASLRIEEVYKECLPPIGTFTNLTHRNVLDTWNLLINKPDLGVRCWSGDLEEKRQAHLLLRDSQPKLVADIISLVTLHWLGVADTVVKAFGKLGVAQSTLDALQRIIYEREGMWSRREGMTLEKARDQYVRTDIDPEVVRRDIEHLEAILKWIRENCEVLPCTAALQINRCLKRKLDEEFQPFFTDTFLLASGPGYLLLSDDERLRSYAATNLNTDAGTDFHIEGVWTQVVLEHCVERGFLDKAEFNKMTLQLVCAHYYHTEFDAAVLIEAAKQSEWNLTEPYNSLVQALGGERMGLSQALDIAVDFLFELWTAPVLHNRSEFLTLGLLEGLTSGRETGRVLRLLADRIRKRCRFLPIAEGNILSLMQAYAQTHPFSDR